MHCSSSVCVSDAFISKCIKAVGKQRCSPALSSGVSLLSRSVGTFQAWLGVWLMFELLSVHFYKPASFIFKRAGRIQLLVLVTANKTRNKLTEYLCTLYCLTTYSSPSLLESADSLFLTHMHAPVGISVRAHQRTRTQVFSRKFKQRGMAFLSLQEPLFLSSYQCLWLI